MGGICKYANFKMMFDLYLIMVIYVLKCLILNVKILREHADQDQWANRAENTGLIIHDVRNITSGITTLGCRCW